MVAAVLIASLLGVHELALLAAAVIVGFIAFRVGSKRHESVDLPALNPAPLFAVSVISTAAASKLWPLFLFFLKTGSVLYGSGYVLLAFLQGELVERRGWLTQTQLLDAVAVGQFTPGPVFTTATFVGYLVSGSPGAALATLGIFLPAFLFVVLSGPFVQRMRRSLAVATILDCVNVASLALMAAVALMLGRAALSSGLGVVLFAIASILLLRTRINSAWLMLAAIAIGLVLRTG